MVNEMRLRLGVPSYLVKAIDANLSGSVVHANTNNLCLSEKSGPVVGTIILALALHQSL